MARRGGVEGIEWGADVHVPPGDVVSAESIAKHTRDAGLAMPSYGSYYVLGGKEGQAPFDAVLDSALALGCRIIRVWPGHGASADAGEADRRRIADDGQRVAGLAAAHGLKIATEWHGNSLTDCAVSAQALFDAVAHPGFGTYWQPPQGMPVDDCLLDMETALPRLLGLHVFAWDTQTRARLPLAEGHEVWQRCLAKAAAAGGVFAMLEFVRENSPEQFLADAAVLREWLL